MQQFNTFVTSSSVKLNPSNLSCCCKLKESLNISKTVTSPLDDLFFWVEKFLYFKDFSKFPEGSSRWQGLSPKIGKYFGVISVFLFSRTALDFDSRRHVDSLLWRHYARVKQVFPSITKTWCEVWSDRRWCYQNAIQYSWCYVSQVYYLQDTRLAIASLVACVKQHQEMYCVFGIPNCFTKSFLMRGHVRCVVITNLMKQGRMKKILANTNSERFSWQFQH